MTQRRAGRDARVPTTVGFAIVVPFVAFALVLIIYPFVNLLRTAFGEPDGAGNFAQFFEQRTSLRIVLTTVRDPLIAMVIAIFFGSVLAWKLKTSGRLMRIVILGLVLAPLWMGGAMKAYAFTVLLQSNGVVNSVLKEIGLPGAPFHLLYTQLAVVLGFVYYAMPYAVLPLYAVFNSIDESLIRAAEVLGASRRKALVSVVVPLAAPGVLASSLMIFLILSGYFVTPVLLGGATSPFIASFIQQDVFTFFNLPQAAVSAVILLGVALLALLMGVRHLGKDAVWGALR